MGRTRPPLGHVIAVVIALILIGWLITRYLTKRQFILGLRERNLAIRVVAARKLLERDQLSDALPAQPIVVRSKTAQALGEIGSDQALAVLGEILRDQEEGPRISARRALVKLGMRSMPVLLSALSTTGSTLEETITALKQIAKTAGPETAEEVRFLLSDRKAYKGAAAAEPQLGPAGAPPLLRACYNADADLRVEALNNLGLQRVKAAVAPALYNLGSDPNNKKGEAIKALGFIGDRSAVPALIPFLKDKDNREAAATSLGLLRDPRAVEPIIATLLVPERRYRDAAILALRRIGPPALPALVRELNSPQVFMREGAAAALIGSNSPSVNAPLIAALRDPDPEVRSSAAQALGWRGNVAAVPSLVPALSDRSWQVVESAVAALGAVGVSAADQLLALLGRPAQDVTVSYQIARGLAAMGRSVVPKLTAALTDPSPSVQTWSAVALGEIGDPSAVPALERLRDTAGPKVRWVAQEQLRRLASMSGT